MRIITIALLTALAALAPANAQDVRFHDRAGRVTGSARTDANGVTTFHDRAGRVTGTAAPPVCVASAPPQQHGVLSSVYVDVHLTPQKDRRVLKGKCLPMAQTLRLPLTQTSARLLYVIGHRKAAASRPAASHVKQRRRHRPTAASARSASSRTRSRMARCK